MRDSREEKGPNATNTPYFASDKRDSGATLVCSSVIVKQCPEPGNDAPNGHQHSRYIAASNLTTHTQKKIPHTFLYFYLTLARVPTRHHLFARGARDLAHFGLLWRRAQHVLCPAAVQRSLKYTQTLLLLFLGVGGGSMVADAAPLGHYYLCIHLCSHWNNSRAPAAAFPSSVGGQHQSRSAAFLIQLDVPAARGLNRSNRKEQQKEQEQPPFRGGFKAKPPSMGDHCLYYPCRLTHL